MKIYVATSWRNPGFTEVVRQLKEAGHQIYNFRRPYMDDTHTPKVYPFGFSWSDLDPDWKNWDAETYRECLLNSSIAAQGFQSDFRAMQWADACVMVLPCGRSAHTEMGWFTGQGKRTIILLEEKVEPELMYLQATNLCVNMQEVLEALR